MYCWPPPNGFTCLFFVGRFALIEMNAAHPENDISTGRIVLQNVATEAGIDKSTGSVSTEIKLNVQGVTVHVCQNLKMFEIVQVLCLEIL